MVAHEGILYKVSRLYAHSEEDRKDLFQDILLQLWQAYPYFRAEAKITTWMYRVALNTAIARVRKSKQVFTSLNESCYQIASPELEEQQAVDLQKAIAQLNEVEKDIARIMGISATNVGYKLHQIKKKLRKTITA